MPPPDNERGPGESPDPDDNASTPTGTPQGNPLDGLEPVPCQCWPCRWHRAADEAIDRNGVAHVEGATSLLVVADVVMAEAVANGETVPDTYQLVRDDGRRVYVFRDPERVAS